MFFVFIIFMVVFPNQSAAVKRIGHDEVYLGNDTNVNKTLRFNQQGLGVDPFIRYDSSANKFVFASDGAAQNQLTTFVDAGNKSPIIRSAECNLNGHTCSGTNSNSNWWSLLEEAGGGGTPLVGEMRIVFDSDLFDGGRTEYSCNLTPLNNDVNCNCIIQTSTANHIEVHCARLSNNTVIDTNFYITCMFYDN